MRLPRAWDFSQCGAGRAATYLQAVDRCGTIVLSYQPHVPQPSFFHITILVFYIAPNIVPQLILSYQPHVPQPPHSFISPSWSTLPRTRLHCPQYHLLPFHPQMSIAFFQTKHCRGRGEGSTLQSAARRLWRKVPALNLDQICKLLGETLSHHLQTFRRDTHTCKFSERHSHLTTFGRDTLIWKLLGETLSDGKIV